MPLCTCNYPFYSAYKSLNHRVNFGQFKLCIDIEKSPGLSVYVDATKPIHAAYCQENVAVFGENAGQQCVAISLCALVYSMITKITSDDDMIQIMIVGNKLYSRLSLLKRQYMLMLTELPGMVTVFERFFRLEYSESYSCNMHGDSRIEGYHYCMPLGTAFETFLALNFHSFILTVGIIGVGIYSIKGGVLLEKPSMHKLVQYFQSLYKNEDIYELKGVHIANFEVDLFQAMLNIVAFQMLIVINVPVHRAAP